MSARAPSPVAGSPLGGRVRPGLVVSLLAIAAVGWALLAGVEAPMAGEAGALLPALAAYTAVWAVMVAAMMFPSTAPMVAMYERMAAARAGGRAERGLTAAFVAGYVLSWAASGALAFAALRAGAAVADGALAWQRAGHLLAGAVVLAAAVYQLTPLKDACLSRCRSPFGFLVARWRGGRLGAVRMGAGHGAWCVGCCWGLMAALVALGAMSLGWMALVAALIAAEKLLPWPAAAARGTAALLALLAAVILLAPDALPGMPMSSDAMGSGPGRMR